MIVGWSSDCHIFKLGSPLLKKQPCDFVVRLYYGNFAGVVDRKTWMMLGTHHWYGNSHCVEKAIFHVVQANDYLNKENGVDIVSDEGCFAVVFLCAGP